MPLAECLPKSVERGLGVRRGLGEPALLIEVHTQVAVPQGRLRVIGARALLRASRMTKRGIFSASGSTYNSKKYTGRKNMLRQTCGMVMAAVAIVAAFPAILIRFGLM